jgi:hypothetical protein
MIHLFDSLLNEALLLAEGFSMIIGEQAWFEVLDFVNGYAARAPAEITAQLKKRTAEDRPKIERVGDFLEQRKYAVLARLPQNISLQQLCEELNLDFREIKEIYDSKVSDYRENHKYLKLAKRVQLTECNAVQTDYLRVVRHGLALIEDTRYCRCGNAHPFSGEAQGALQAFLCGHIYHQQCLDKENECKQCVRKTIEVSKNEIKKAAQQLKGGAESDAAKQVRRAK